MEPEEVSVQAGEVARVERTPDGLDLVLDGRPEAGSPPPRIRLTAEAPGVLRLRLAPGGTFTDPLPGLLNSGLSGAQVDLSVAEDARTVTVSTALLRVAVERRPLRLIWSDADGRELGATEPGGLFWTPGGNSGGTRGMAAGRGSGGAVGVRLVLAPGEAVYGLGEKIGGLDRRGRRWVFWNTDVTPHLPDTDPLYVSIPFWMSLRPEAGGTTASGWFLLAPGRSAVDAGAAAPDRLAATVDGGALDLFVMAGPAPAEVVRRFTALTGRMPLPPLWAVGHHHSRWGHESAADLLDCAREFRRRGIPCDVLYLDIDHMDGFRVFTWDPGRFPDPEGLARELEAAGFRLVTIVDPGVKADPGYDLYREGLAGGHFVLLPDGRPFHGDVWPGRCAFPDFLRPETREWWGEWIRRHAARGVAGVWNDMNEPAVFGPDGTGTFPPDVGHRVGAGRTVRHAEVHNLYGQLMARAAAEALDGWAPRGGEAAPGLRSFVLTRSGFAGVQRYAAVWTGDNTSSWEHLGWMIPMLAGLGLSGVPFVGADVGGFAGDVDGELFARWVQAAALTPLFRNHSAVNTRRQEPWTFGPEVEAVARRAISLRYRLLPYLYGAFEEASRTGAPVMRPLVYEFPADPEARAVADQYLVGRDLLVAPVLEPGAGRRRVYLPEGKWLCLPAGPHLAGPGRVEVSAPLSELPLFGRAGAVLPLWPVAPSVAQVDRSVLELEVVGHMGPPEAAVRELYEDDGATVAYRRGGSARTRVAHGLVDGGYQVALGAAEGGYRVPRRQVVIRLHLPPGTGGRRVAGVAVDGREVPEREDPTALPGLAGEWLRPAARAACSGGPGFALSEPAPGARLVVAAFPNDGRAASLTVRLA